MPTELPVGEKIAEFMPITWPSVLNSGPPELPGLIGASIWMKSSNSPAPRSRPRAETMPAETEPPRPNGLPQATTQSPTSTAALSPHTAAGSGVAGSTLMTATSVSSSAPISLAGNWVPSDRLTTIASALPTTWLLVTITPDGSMMKPEPAPVTCSRRLRRRSRNWRCSSGGSRAKGSAPPTVSVTAMFTTLGITRLTSGAKLSGPLRASAGRMPASSTGAAASATTPKARRDSPRGRTGRPDAAEAGGMGEAPANERYNVNALHVAMH